MRCARDLLGFMSVWEKEESQWRQGQSIQHDAGLSPLKERGKEGELAEEKLRLRAVQF